MQLRSYKDVGHDFFVPDSFEAPILPEWRLAAFSLILPIPQAASLSKHGDPFDFGKVDGWRYGRDKGVRTIENPAWDNTTRRFRKPMQRLGYYGDPIVEGGRPYYNDARSRFMDPLDASVGAGSVDVDIDLHSYNSSAGDREVFDHEELEELLARNAERLRNPVQEVRESTLADAGWDPRIHAHHVLFEPVRNETLFYLVNYDEQLPWEDQKRGVRDSHGPATLRLLSAEVMQFHDLELTDLAGEVPEPAQVTSEFLILNVVAENISSATLGFLSATLRRPRNSSQFYKHDNFYRESPPQLYALTKFTNLAIERIDAALGRERSMRVSSEGRLVATAAAPGPAGTFTLPAPQRVVFAVPNPAKPAKSLRLTETLSEGNNGSVPDTIGAPLILRGAESTWAWHEQWAWQLMNGADSYPEQVPAQTNSARDGFVAAKLSSWTIMTSDEGVAMVRTKSASREGMRYWSMAGTRFVDLVMLQMRAQAGETHLRKSLQIVGEQSQVKREGDQEVRQRALRADLDRLEKLQLDHIEIRDKLWFRSVPNRDIDTRILKGLQDATDFDQLRDDFDSKVDSRQDVIGTQFEQLSGQIAEAEAKRAEAMNLVLGFVAAAVGAPDWADAAGVESLGGMLLLGLIIFVAMFVVVALMQAAFKMTRRR